MLRDKDRPKKELVGNSTIEDMLKDPNGIAHTESKKTEVSTSLHLGENAKALFDPTHEQITTPHYSFSSYSEPMIWETVKYRGTYNKQRISWMRDKLLEKLTHAEAEKDIEFVGYIQNKLLVANDHLITCDTFLNELANPHSIHAVTTASVKLVNLLSVFTLGC